MDKNEKAALGAPGNNVVSLKAPDLHMVVSIGWRKTEGIRSVFSRLLTGNDLVKNMESCYKRSMKQYGYEREDYVQCQAGGVSAEGLRYTYTAEGIEMTAESYVLEKDQAIYYLHCYYRTKFSQESRVIWKQLLDSAEWK